MEWGDHQVSVEGIHKVWKRKNPKDGDWNEGQLWSIYT
jgi:hypothetical protein